MEAFSDDGKVLFVLVGYRGLIHNVHSRTHVHTGNIAFPFVKTISTNPGSQFVTFGSVFLLCKIYIQIYPT